jgi:PTH1 family peptidyl-tRNA hydrolase
VNTVPCISKLPNFDDNIWSDLKVIVGLGNPTPQYENTRHNAGAIIVSLLADRLSLRFERKANYNVAIWQPEPFGEKILALVIPVVFMNNSGEIFPALCRFTHATAENILIIHDELEKKPGTFGFKFAGSDRGHNGLKSVAQSIGENFYRLRVGIGRPKPETSVADYVLGEFSNEDLFTLELFTDQLCAFIKEAS